MSMAMAERAMIAVEFASLLPLTILLAVAVVAAALFGFSLWRRQPAAIWRLLTAAILLLVLANPAVVLEDREPQKDVAILLLDESRSQSIGQRPEQVATTAKALSENLQKLKNLEVRTVVMTAADGITGDAPQSLAGQEGTRLFADISRALADVPRERLAGVIAVTDGQVHDAASTIAGGLNAPLHVLLTGAAEETDRFLEIKRAPSFGLVGKTTQISLRVTDRSLTAGSLVAVTLRVDDRPPERFSIPANRDYAVALTLKHAGQNVIEMVTPAGPHELTLENNRKVISINGIRDRLKVLLVSGEPHSGERAWRDVLTADPTVDLIHFTILRPREKQDGTPLRELALIAFPYRELFEMKLDEFDLVILDRYHRRGLLPRSYFTNIANYVRNGGALLEASGPSFAGALSLDRTALGEVFPGTPSGTVLEQAFRPKLTEVGRRHPVTAGLLAATKVAGDQPEWGRWMRQIDAQASAGHVVMSGAEERPLIILDRVEEGRVAHILSDHLWLWTRGFDGGGPGLELLRRMAHWLMKEPELEENSLHAVVDGQKLNIIRRRLEPDPSPLTVTGPDGRSVQLRLSDRGDGVAVASTLFSGAGVYRISDGQVTQLVAVGAINPLEMLDVQATAEHLQPVAVKTGGGVFWLADDGLPNLRQVARGQRSIGNNWIGLTRNNDYSVKGVRSGPLLPAAIALLVIFAGLITAWRRESR